MAAFELSVLIENMPAILLGVLTTCFISFVSAGIAVLIGLLVAIFRRTTSAWAVWGFEAYVQFFRNTPLLIQMFFFYKGLPNMGIVLSPLSCGVLALSLQSGAYMAEIFRTGIDAVPREQYEGGISLGLSKLETYLRIVLPQAIAVILPLMGNQVVGLIKNSSLVAFITVPDLFFIIYQGSASEFRYLEYFSLGVVIYMGLTLAVTGLFRWLEHLLCPPQLRKTTDAWLAPSL